MMENWDSSFAPEPSGLLASEAVFEHLCFSGCDPRPSSTSITSITGELVRDAESQAPSQATESKSAFGQVLR